MSGSITTRALSGKASWRYGAVAFGDVRATHCGHHHHTQNALRQTLLLPVRAGLWPPTRDRLPKPRISKIFHSQLYARGTRIRLLGIEFGACFFFPPSKPVASLCQKRASGRRIVAVIRPRRWPGGGARKSPALSASLGALTAGA